MINKNTELMLRLTTTRPIALNINVGYCGWTTKLKTVAGNFKAVLSLTLTRTSFFFTF